VAQDKALGTRWLAQQKTETGASIERRAVANTLVKSSAGLRVPGIGTGFWAASGLAKNQVGRTAQQGHEDGACQQ
ncbi:MAG: hypothetical protein ACRD2O_12385, partial [Terriglobia bacterium]